jgi:hypothetical protein
LYIVCHDDRSQSIASTWWPHWFPSHRFHTRLVRVHPSPFFESTAFWHIAQCATDWRRFDYVGLVPYNLPDKLPAPPDVHAMIASSSPPPDVLALLSFDCGDLISHALRWHGANFLRAWHTLLERVSGPSAAAYACAHRLPQFFANAWLARADAFRDYMCLALRAMLYMSSDALLAELLDHDAMYRGHMRPAELQCIFGRPHYCLHPFVMERLPCFHFAYAGLRIHLHRPEKINSMTQSQTPARAIDPAI